MTDLFAHVLLPVATEEDARSSCRALAGHLGPNSHVVAVHVVEKAGGAPDKAGVEQREAVAEAAFDAVRAGLDVPVETEIRYDTAVDDAIFDAAHDHGVSAIVITPRGGSRWIRLLTGDVALSLVTESDLPVVVLPDRAPETAGEDTETPGNAEDA